MKERYLDEPERFFFTIMVKTNHSLDAANIFIRNFSSRTDFQPTLHIIIRAIISDVITGEYVRVISKDEENMKEVIDDVYHDHVVRTFKSIHGIYSRLNELNEDEINEMKRGFIETNSKYFNNNDELIVKSSNILPEKMVSKMFSQKQKGEQYHAMRALYSNYDLFSKYEHLGELTFSLIHKPYT